MYKKYRIRLFLVTLICKRDRAKFACWKAIKWYFYKNYVVRLLKWRCKVIANYWLILFFIAGTCTKARITNIWLVGKTASYTTNESLRLQCNERWWIPKQRFEAYFGWTRSLRLSVSAIIYQKCMYYYKKLKENSNFWQFSI